MDELNQILKDIMQMYSGRGLGCWLFPVFDDQNQHYTVIGVNHPKREGYADIALFVRLQHDKIIIEDDQTDKPLIDRLLKAGIPREQIILAYEGEPLPEI
jgi:hypothetical protein